MSSSRRSRLVLLTVASACLAVAAGAPGASAEQRYAGPLGAGNACSDEFPCKIDWAVGGAGPGDEVIVKPGDYDVGYAVKNKAPVTVHGIAGQPRPRLHMNAGSYVLLQDAELSDVEVVQNSPTLTGMVAVGSELDRVIVRGGQQASCAVGLSTSSAVRNSVVVARNPSGNAICAGGPAPTSSVLLNVTAVAQSGAAIFASAGDYGATTYVQAVNVIAKAGPAGVGFAANAGLGGPVTITVADSNYAKTSAGIGTQIINAGGNQSLAPSFVDEASGDYRQKPGSPTIDAGEYDPDIGPFDVEGDPRNVGPTDIGADEFVPAPAASTGAAGAVTSQSATLAGTVNPKGAPTRYRFEYGTTTAYGSSTSDGDAGSGLGDAAASASVAGLSPGTTYHYRVVASNAGGVVYGGDQTFTTSVPAATSPAAFAGVKLLSSGLTLRRGFIGVKLSCPAGTTGRCTGVTKLSARRRRAGSRSAATVALGRARFSIAAGGQAKLKVRVSRTGRRLFAGTRRVRGRAASAAHDGAGASKTTVARVTIRKGTR